MLSKYNKTLIILFCILLYSGLFALSMNLNQDFILISNGIIVMVIITVYLFNKEEILIYALIITSLNIRIIDIFNLPHVLVYLPEYFVLIILMRLFYLISKKKIKIEIDAALILLIILACFNLISFFINDYSIINFLWGIRNNYKFIIALAGFIYFRMKPSSYKKIIKFFIIFAFIQFPIVVYQYKLNFVGDNIAGVFGDGGTGMLAQYLMYVYILILSLFLFKLCRIELLIIYIIMMVIIAAIAEIKVLYVYVALATGYLLLRRKINFKSILILSITIILLYKGYNIFLQFYPRWQGVFTQEKLYYYLFIEGYGGEGTLSRLGAPIYVFNNILNSEPLKLLGVGIGNASPSNISLLQGNYFINYGDLKYYWFFSSYFLMENGIMGTCIFIATLLCIYMKSILLNNKLLDGLDKALKYSIELCILFTIMTLFYNDSILYNQAGFIFCFIISMLYKIKAEGFYGGQYIEKSTNN